MRIIKWLAGIVVLLGLVLVVGGWALPSTFTVSRSVVVQATADKVDELVADPRRWKEWSVWNRRDPAMEIVYFGPDRGTGAGWAWKSKSEGDGKMTFTAAQAGQHVAFDLYFPDMDSTSKGELVFSPDSNATRVTWTMHGDFGRNPLMHWFSLFADRMVGPDFEAGLANLKEVAEKK